MTEKSATKSELAMLGRVFAAEVENRLPFQSKAKATMQYLESKGYVQPLVTMLPGRFPVRIEGWQLTHLGRLTYCATCEES